MVQYGAVNLHKHGVYAIYLSNDFIVGIAVMSLYTACYIAVNPFKTPLLHFFIYMKMFGFLRFCTAVWYKIGTRSVQDWYKPQST